MEAQFVDPEETESELQQQRDYLHSNYGPGDANLIPQKKKKKAPRPVRDSAFTSQNVMNSTQWEG